MTLVACENENSDDAGEAGSPAPGTQATTTPVPTPDSTPLPELNVENEVDETASSAIDPMPLISRDAPVSASSEIWPAGEATSDEYESLWRGEVPSTFEVDLSEHTGIDAVLVAWYGDVLNSEFDLDLSGGEAYNLPRDYTISVSADGSDWQDVEAVTGNTLHSRQHLVDFTGQRFLRLEVTEVNGTEENHDVAIALDVHDASDGVDDNFLILGDSITVGTMRHTSPTFSQLVHELAPEHYPVQHSGGMSGWHSSDGAEFIEDWLPLFGSRYVGLAYGTNDALTSVHPDQFADSMQRMIDAVNDAGKIAVLPSIPYATHDLIQENQPELNLVLEDLAEQNEGAIPGPDLYNVIAEDPDLVADDRIHPTGEGMALIRAEWARFVVREIYELE